MPGLDTNLGDWVDEIDGRPAGRITLEQLLSMRSGLAIVANEPFSAEVVADAPLAAGPGSAYSYVTDNSELLALGLDRRAPDGLCRYLHERVLGPMGVSVDHWHETPYGNVTGGSYAFLTPRELARLGQLLLDTGRWADEQLVPASWIESMTEVRSDFGCHRVNAATATSPVRQGRGMGIVTTEVAGYDVWEAGGFGGQAILVVPDLDVVVVITQEVGPVFERRPPILDVVDALVRTLPDTPDSPESPCAAPSLILRDDRGAETELAVSSPGLFTDWSPDGEQIAFVAVDHLNPEIELIADDGTGLRRLTDDGAADVLPRWSPDGTQIAFASDRGAPSHVALLPASRRSDGRKSPWKPTALLSGTGFPCVDLERHRRPVHGPRALGVASSSLEKGAVMAMREYRPGSAFSGVIGRTVEESSPAWPEPKRAREGAPNVLFVVLDDTGFAQLGCYGSPIATPNIDRLADNGLRYNNMHTTALCSPTRTCILTGRNHHSNGMACITEASTGYPGSNGNIPFENGFLSEMLLDHGYNTYAIGKWHLTPADQISAAGPYDRWPLGRGFERYYGFLGGETHQYFPELVYDNHSVEPPARPEDGYHVTEDLVDKAISFITDSKQVAPDKPFFMYFCTGAMHAPHHVAKEWSDKYAGAFDDGWGAYREAAFARQKELGIVPADAELSRHDPDVPDWDTLGADEKKLYSRMMEVFAGFLEHTDHHIGRLIDHLEQLGELDNTIVMVISDNGASSEGGPQGSVNENLFFNNVPESLEENLAAIDELGGPTTFNHYAWGWTFAGNTPFRRWKRETYRGGISDPFIVHWPDGVSAKGEVREQYAHAIDMVPTILEAAGIEPPQSVKGVTQSPIEGVSLAHTFNDPGATSKRNTQYFEMMGHRSIYHDGWRAVCPWPGPSFTESGGKFGDPISKDTLTELDAEHWELYHVAEDFAENHDVSAEHRDRLIALIGMWYVEAGKYNVLPVDGRGTARFAEQRPQLSPNRDRYVYYPGTQGIPTNAAAVVLNRSHAIVADVEIPDGGAEGMIVVHGGTDGGYGLYVKDGKLTWVHNYCARDYFTVVSTEDVPSGRHQLRFEFGVTGAPDFATGKGTPGRAQLYFDERLVASKDIPVTTPLSLGLTSPLMVGQAPGAPVCPDIDQQPFAFTGVIHSVTYDVTGDLIEDDELTLRRLMARQ